MREHTVTGAMCSTPPGHGGYRRAMAVYALGDLEPKIHPEAFIHPDAVIIGAVSIGAHSSVWPSAVLRGDDGEIRVGERSSIQDGSVLHTTPDDPTVVGNECVIGHLVHLEGCTIEDRALVGNMAMVLHRSVVGTGAVVGANSVVLYDVDVPPGALAVGSPAVIKPDKARLEDILAGVETYVARARRFRDELRRID